MKKDLKRDERRFINRQINDSFSVLSTPLIADACLRLKIPFRLPAPGLHALIPTVPIAGRVLPAKHSGSVDVFLEAIENSCPGDVLVIDNEGRQDEACIGDLTVLEAQDSELSGVLVWGYHRDNMELLQIGLPVFSYGTSPSGPQRLDPRAPNALEKVQFGTIEVSREDVVFADSDGAVFVQEKSVDEVLNLANQIWQIERMQANAIQEGKSLRAQLEFRDYLKKRSQDPSYTFRKHLRKLGGAIEE
jgi:4-hydroxy-4-methyl-2-oxoglutarate aldolase